MYFKTFVSGFYSKLYAVEYPQRNICAVKGSSVLIPCSFQYPSDERVQRVIWFNGKSNKDEGPSVFDSNLNYTSSRFKYIGNKRNCSLAIQQVEPGDAGNYTFRFKTNKDSFSGFTSHPILRISGKLCFFSELNSSCEYCFHLIFN